LSFSCLGCGDDSEVEPTASARCFSDLVKRPPRSFLKLSSADEKSLR
jgi:hypothetical protein